MKWHYRAADCGLQTACCSHPGSRQLRFCCSTNLISPHFQAFSQTQPSDQWASLQPADSWKGTGAPLKRPSALVTPPPPSHAHRKWQREKRRSYLHSSCITTDEAAHYLRESRHNSSPPSCERFILTFSVAPSWFLRTKENLKTAEKLTNRGVKEGEAFRYCSKTRKIWG